MNPVIQLVKDKDPEHKEFHQAVTEVLETIQPVMDQNPEYRSAKILERLVEPERRVPFYYPAISGVAQAQNYYPLGRLQAEDGLVTIALGLGKQVVCSRSSAIP